MKNGSQEYETALGPSSATSRTLLHADLNQQPSFRAVIATGVRTVNAVWLAPLLLFVLLAPQQTGACAELLVLRASGRQLPPWMIVLAIVGHLSLLWWIVVFFGLPWIVAGAAAQFRDGLIPPERSRGYAAHANHFYGRSLALWMLIGIVLVLLAALLYLFPMWLMAHGDGPWDEDLEAMFNIRSHPVMLACTALWWLAGAAFVTACDLVLAAVAIDDLDLFRASRRAVSFIRDHRTDTARLWLFVILLGLPDLVLQQTFVLVPMPAVPLLLLGLCTAAYNACAIPLLVAVAESLSLARRPAILDR